MFIACSSQQSCRTWEFVWVLPLSVQMNCSRTQFIWILKKIQKLNILCQTHILCFIKLPPKMLKAPRTRCLWLALRSNLVEFGVRVGIAPGVQMNSRIQFIWTLRAIPIRPLISTRLLRRVSHKHHALGTFNIFGDLIKQMTCIVESMYNF